jgi:hypothetical protein
MKPEIVAQVILSHCDDDQVEELCQRIDALLKGHAIATSVAALAKTAAWPLHIAPADSDHSVATFGELLRFYLAEYAAADDDMRTYVQ